MTNNTQFIKNYTKLLITIFAVFVIGVFVMAYFDKDNDGYGDYYFDTFTGQYYRHHIKGDIRYLVPDVNQDLARLIPKDVHYVSYHPKIPKAVYCYYPTNDVIQENIHHLNVKPFSKCYFVKLMGDVVQTADISELIRINLQIYYKNSSQSFNKNLYADNPYVERWVDRGDLFYGMYFVVNPQFDRFGWGDYY